MFGLRIPDYLITFISNFMLKNNRIQMLEETPEVREQNPSTTPPDPVHGLQRRRGYLFNFTFTVRIRL